MQFVRQKNVCYSLGEIYFKSNVGFFHCLDKKTGLPDFSIPFESPLIGKPLILKSPNSELAIFSSFNGEVCAVNLLTKTKVWCVKTGSEKTSYAFSSPNYDVKRNVLWYASADNGLFAFNPINGAIITHWLPKQSAFKTWNDTLASVTIHGDSLYLSDMEGVLRRLDVK